MPERFVAKGGGTVGANAAEMHEGFYGKVIRGEMKPAIVVASAPGKEPGISDSKKLTDHALSCRAAVLSGDGDGFQREFGHIYERFLHIANFYNLEWSPYAELLEFYHNALWKKLAHHGFPEDVFAHILTDAIPNAVLLDPTHYIESDNSGRLVLSRNRSKRRQLQEELGNGIGVMPGFVAFGKEGRSSTLGRGGSDASAAAMARYLNAPCVIYTDTDGVLSADHRIVPEARNTFRLAFGEIAEAAMGGTYVVHEEAIPPLEESDGRLEVRHYKDEGKGTLIMRNRKPHERELAKIITGTKDRKVMQAIRYGSNRDLGFLYAIASILLEERVSVHDLATGTNSITFTVGENVDLKKIGERIKKEGGANKVRRRPQKDERAAVSVIGKNVPKRIDEILHRVSSALKEVGVRPHPITYELDGINLTLYVPRSRFEDAVRALHEKIIEKEEMEV